MGLIKKANELEILPTVKMMIYGQAGMGKTTLALSAPKPLLLDFDNGVKRVNDAHLEGVDIVQVGNWAEIKNLIERHSGELQPYQTIVVDTVGKMVDFVIQYVCGTKMPSIKDWGKVNQEFQWLCRALGDLRKNVVFVAHRDTRKEGEDTVFIPSLREKNYNTIVTELDLLGYLEMRSDRGVQKRTITFDPTNRNDGKNTCCLPAVMNIPEVVDRQGNKTAENDFIATAVIAPYRNMLETKARARQGYMTLMNDIAVNVAAIQNAEDANRFVQYLGGVQHIGSSLEQARALFGSRVKKLGLTYDKNTQTYSDAETN